MRPPAASIRARRCEERMTSPARATTGATRPSSRAVRSSSADPRASMTRLHPSKARAPASARPRPREAPVMTAVGMAGTLGRVRSQFPGAIGPRTRGRVCLLCEAGTDGDVSPGVLGLVLLAAVAHAAWNLLAKGAQGGAAFVWLAVGLSTVLYLPALAVVLARDADVLG